MGTISSLEDIYIQQNGSDIQYKIGISGSWTNITSFPITINNTGSNIINVLFINSLTITDVNTYFICGSQKITFDGSNNEIDINNVINYNGFIKNGTSGSDGYANIIVKNFIMRNTRSTFTAESSILCMSYFGKSALNNQIINCSTIIDNTDDQATQILTDDYMGGICGAYAGSSNGNVTITDCSNMSFFGSTYCGGICGAYAGSNNGNITINFCYNTGFNNDYSGGTGLSGGMVGAFAGSNNGNVTINNCYNTGQIDIPNITSSSGGICGAYTGQNNGNIAITDCYNTGIIYGDNSGGICGIYCGDTSGNIIITDCYSTGLIIGSSSGGIVGSYAGNNNGSITIQNCFNTGNMSISTSPQSDQCGGIVGTGFGVNSTFTCYITNCYNTGQIYNFGGGILAGFQAGSYTGNINITNCYTLGDISVESGGITGQIAMSNNVNITLENCYTYGLYTQSNYFFAPSTTVPNQTTNCYNANGVWSDTDAHTTLTNINTVWRSISTNIPFILKSFNKQIYNPNNDTLLVYESYESEYGIYENSNYILLTVNNSTPPDPSIISINSANGQFGFNNYYQTDIYSYVELVFVSKGTSPYYHSYNTNTFTLNLTQSDICFAENTPIMTDQGIISINMIDPEIHTIDNKKIIAITRTISNEDYLVCFNKNSLGHNYPSDKIILTKGHKIYYNGLMLNANYFIDKFKNVTTVKYNREILYNVLMEKYDMITVNNLICETLHPNNIIAKIYNPDINYKFNIEKEKEKEKENKRNKNKNRLNTYINYKKIKILS